MIRFIRDVVLNNWGLKLLALLLAFILWLSMIPEERTFSEKTVAVPLETLNIPAGMEIVEKPQTDIDVSIRAPNSIIATISAANIFAKLDLEKATVFQQEYPLNDSMISIPPGAQVVRISPNQVRIKLERTGRMLLDVVPVVVGKPAEGRTVAKIEAAPARVMVEGPESRLREKDRVTTSPVNVSGIEATTTFTADLILPRPELRLAGAQPRVQVRVSLRDNRSGSQGPGLAQAESRSKPMRLALNIDHFATLRQARRGAEPDPVLVALLAEQAGAEGIVVHLRGDRRHIQDRDIRLLRQVVKTKLNVEMAATPEMKRIALEVLPDVVSLVPEKPEELTTEGGLNVAASRDALAAFIADLHKAKIRVSIFVDTDLQQIRSCREAGVSLVEINTGKYADQRPGPAQAELLRVVKEAAVFGRSLGLEVHAGHGLDYRNVQPIAALPEISELSIGFSIVARAAVVGLERAVEEMIALLGSR